MNVCAVFRKCELQSRAQRAEGIGEHFLTIAYGSKNKRVGNPGRKARTEMNACPAGCARIAAVGGANAQDKTYYL